MAKDSRFLQALAIHAAGGMSIRDAAKAADCSERQAYALAATSEFKTEVARLKSEFIERAVLILSSNATAASEALVKLLKSEDEKIILASATKLLGLLQPLQELAELRARIDAIESQGPGLRVAR